ncbi:MAG: hypothetical protein IH626_22955 [Rhodospirillales bacterium]|nr:hypothetical protein [Rhodospirillales bacterium]
MLVPTPSAFRQLLAERNVALPLSVSPDDPAVVIDDHGNDVITVDPNGWRGNADVAAISALIVEAVNASGGYLRFTLAALVNEVIAKTETAGVPPAEPDPECACRPAGWGE